MALSAQQLKENFSKQIKNGKLSHAYLFIDANNNNEELVEELISILLSNDETLNDYFNFISVKPDDGKKNISIDQLRSLQETFQTSSKENEPKIALISPAQLMTNQAQNSILKFIEEPASNQFIFLVADNPNNLLPTIVSRTQTILLPDSQSEKIESQLISDGLNVDDAKLLAKISKSINEAEELQVDGFFFNFKNDLQTWINEIETENSYAFIFVESNLIKYFNETKIGQDLLIELLNSQFPKHVRLLEITLSEFQKINFNVQVQAILESITIKGLIHD
jgi:DNA polymerase-3 subunit delta'